MFPDYGIVCSLNQLAAGKQRRIEAEMDPRVDKAILEDFDMFGVGRLHARFVSEHSISATFFSQQTGLSTQMYGRNSTDLAGAER